MGILEKAKNFWAESEEVKEARQVRHNLIALIEKKQLTPRKRKLLGHAEKVIQRHRIRQIALAAALAVAAVTGGSTICNSLSDENKSRDNGEPPKPTLPKVRQMN